MTTLIQGVFVMGMKIPPELEKQIMAMEGVVVKPHVIKVEEAGRDTSSLPAGWMRAAIHEGGSVAQPSSILHRIGIPQWRPYTDNELLNCHWRVKHKRKAADKERVGIYAHVQHIPKAVGKRRVSLEIVLTGRQKQVDPWAYNKSLMDALVQNGLLVDDSSEWVEFGGITYSRGKKGSEMTTIVLEEIPA